MGIGAWNRNRIRKDRNMINDKLLRKILKELFMIRTACQYHITAKKVFLTETNPEIIKLITK